MISNITDNNGKMMMKNKRAMSEEFASKANEDFGTQAKILIVQGDDNIDLLEVTKDWMKFRSKRTKKTYLLERDNYLKIVYSSVKVGVESNSELEDILSDKLRKRVQLQNLPDDFPQLATKIEDDWWSSIVQQILNVGAVPSLIGPYKDLERSIFKAKDIKTGDFLDVEESGSFKMCKFKNLYMFFKNTGFANINNDNEIWTMCIPPASACGKELKSESFVDEVEENAIPKNLKYLLDKNSDLKDIDIDMNEDEILDEADDASSSACAARRMKLFEAARHYGADIFKKNDWIAAACWTYEQCHVFGRLKPKVKPGTNEIDPDCNLEDWEGITPENKAKRDDWSLPWIKDGIDDKHGKSFDHLSGESGQPKKSFGCETAWCNCGVLNGDGTWKARDRSNMYFDYYNNHGKTPYLILMDMSRGALYQYVHMKNRGDDIINFLNEDDKVDGGRLGNPPDRDQMTFFKEFCAENSGFAEFISELDTKYY